MCAESRKVNAPEYGSDDGTDLLLALVIVNVIKEVIQSSWTKQDSNPNLARPLHLQVPDQYAGK